MTGGAHCRRRIGCKISLSAEGKRPNPSELEVVHFLRSACCAVVMLLIVVKALNVQGNNTCSVVDLRDAVRAIAAARIQPVIDKTFDCGETMQAYANLAAGDHFGKIALVHG
jgi:D-arabinose 1-dehydrogenase-like Zn-dependent alcohol dehydrogenase